MWPLYPFDRASIGKEVLADHFVQGERAEVDQYIVDPDLDLDESRYQTPVIAPTQFEEDLLLRCLPGSDVNHPPWDLIGGLIGETACHSKVTAGAAIGLMAKAMGILGAAPVAATPVDSTAQPTGSVEQTSVSSSVPAESASGAVSIELFETIRGNETMRGILLALLVRSPQTKEALSASAFNSNSNGTFSGVLTSLQTFKLISSGGSGRGSQGYQLTEAGKKVAEMLQK